MGDRATRRELKRVLALAEIAAQVKRGELRIRKATAKERAAWAKRPPSPVVARFRRDLEAEDGDR
jgi:hypothetical protein